MERTIGEKPMNKWASIILISIGVLFLVYAIFGRYLVLPGYLEGLEQGNTTLATASQDVSAWKVIRYLLRAYSFKLGLLFIVFGAAFLTNMSSKGKIASTRSTYLRRVRIRPAPQTHSLGAT